MSTRDHQPRICGKKEFREWFLRQSPLSSGAVVIFVGDLRRFSINVRMSDLKRCFFSDDGTGRSWTFDEFLVFAAVHTKSLAFDYWQCRFKVRRK